MKLKYYLRGLGTGIAVTALIIGISSFVSRKEVMTDEEVIARAKELGMVERTVLSETVTETDENEEESEPEGQTPEESEPITESEEPVESTVEETEPEETEPEETEPEETETEAEPDLETEQEESIPEESESEPEAETATEESEDSEKEEEVPEFGMPDEAGTIMIQIFRGDSSVSVSRRLEEAGLIDSAVDYDRYLCQNGYDKKIQPGNYEIPFNATLEEIAIMITNR